MRLRLVFCFFALALFVSISVVGANRQPSGPGDGECLRAFVASFGRRALRRPLSDEELDRYGTLQAYATESGDFYAAVGLVLRALLQDPEFLYRIENGAPIDGWAAEIHLGKRYLNVEEIGEPNGAVTLKHTIEVFSDGSIRIDGKPYP